MSYKRDKKVEVQDNEEELEFTEIFKDVEDIYEYYKKQLEEKKYPPEKLRVVVLDGQERAYNPEEEEDPRLVKAIMEAEQSGFIEVNDLDEYRKHVEDSVKDD